MNFFVFFTFICDIVEPLDILPENRQLVDFESIQISNRTCLRKDHEEIFNGKKTLLTQLVCDDCVESMRISSQVCSDLGMALVLPETTEDDRMLEKMSTNFFLRLRQKTLGSDLWVRIQIDKSTNKPSLTRRNQHVFIQHVIP